MSSKGYLLSGGVGPAVVWLKFVIHYSDFSAASTTNDIEIYAMPPNGVINSAYTVVSSTFSGGSISNYTIGVGNAGNHTILTGNVALNVFSGLNSNQSNNGNPLIQNPGGASIRAYATSTGDTLDNATQGVAFVYLQVSFLE